MFGMEKEAVVLRWTASAVVYNRAVLPSSWFDLFQQQKKEYTQDQLQTHHDPIPARLTLSTSAER